MKRFVMFGHSQLLGDIVDIIHANGGTLSKIVQNMPEVLHPRRRSLQERIESLGRSGYNIEVQSIDEFVPSDDEHYLIGFTGFKIEPLRKRVAAQFGITFHHLVHPSAIISPSVVISEGVIINAGCIITSEVTLGKHVFLNRGASIGHHTRVDDFAIVQPGANIAGYVHIGYGAVVGLSTAIVEDCEIGAYAMAAAGSVVIKDVPAYSLVAGVPAEHKREINREAAKISRESVDRTRRAGEKS